MGARDRRVDLRQLPGGQFLPALRGQRPGPELGHELLDLADGEAGLAREGDQRQPFENTLVVAPPSSGPLRLGQPEDLVGAAVFFASDDSLYCTGSELAVDGGMSAGL